MVVVVPEWKSLFKCAVLCCTNIICPLVRDEGSVQPQMSKASENNKEGRACYHSIVRFGWWMVAEITKCRATSSGNVGISAALS